ncbi:hypothetical protein VTO73DRAFT_2286 [Trametes versicolor]
MSGADDSEIQAIIDQYPRLLVENYCIVASSALLWFDFVLTLPDEYRRIWTRKLTGATVIYLLMRYVAVIERIFFVLELTLPQTCGGITHTDDVLTILNYFSFTVSIAAKATTIAADGILIVMTWIRTFGINKDAFKMGFNTPLATLILRDGTAYFMVLLVIQMITIVSNQIGHALTIWLVWPYFDQVITVIFLSRFILDLRAIHLKMGDGREIDTTLHLSDVKFEGITSTMIGNLGSTTFSTQIEIPMPEHTEDSEVSPTGSADSFERRYAWEWRDEEVEFSDDPFRAGFQNPDKPPALVASTVEEASERGEIEKVDEAEIQEEARLGDNSPV